LKTLSFILVLFILCAFGTSPVAEQFQVDSTAYEVPAQWLKHKIDSTGIPAPAELVRLPSQYTFDNYRIYVRPETRRAFLAMATQAEQDSIDLIVDSGFRSLSFQRRIISHRLHDGQPIESILTMVAPPGYSEHHTGRALDFVPSEASFARTSTYRWLMRNAGRFGFVESLPDSSDNSLSWEPWHWLYQPAR